MKFLVDKVCYPPYGCFDKSAPFDKPFLPLPNDPSKLDTSFHLFNRENDGILISTNTSWKITKKKLVVITHGFLESGEAKWMHNIKDAIIKSEDSNVVLINWKQAAAIPYTQAVSNLRITSAQIAFFLRGLFDRKIITPSQVHLIGFSLGAHLMGYVGKHFQKEKIQRITGLDPAGPFFQDSVADFRLDSGDGVYVDVIHSDGKAIFGYSTGTLEAIGHADFYPNGGYTQPGCKEIKLEVPSKKVIYDHVTCNHYRAVDYFLESINKSSKFYAYPCESYDEFVKSQCSTDFRNSKPAVMGYYANKNRKGKYYLFTRDAQPFVAHHYRVELQTGEDEFADSVGSLKLQVTGKNGETVLMQEKLTYLDQNDTEAYLLISQHNIGKKLFLKIKHGPGVYFTDSWFLKFVSVTYLRENVRYCGKVKQWLKSEEITIPLSETSCI